MGLLEHDWFLILAKRLLSAFPTSEFFLLKLWWHLASRAVGLGRPKDGSIQILDATTGEQKHAFEAMPTGPISCLTGLDLGLRRRDATGPSSTEGGNGARITKSKASMDYLARSIFLLHKVLAKSLQSPCRRSLQNRLAKRLFRLCGSHSPQIACTRVLRRLISAKIVYEEFAASGLRKVLTNCSQ